MAADAAGNLEQFIAGQLLLGQRTLVAFQPLVETGIRRHQCAFEFSDGVGYGVNGDRAIAVHLCELRNIARNSL